MSGPEFISLTPEIDIPGLDSLLKAAEQSKVPKQPLEVTQELKIEFQSSIPENYQEESILAIYERRDNVSCIYFSHDKLNFALMREAIFRSTLRHFIKPQESNLVSKVYLFESLENKKNITPSEFLCDIYAGKLIAPEKVVIAGYSHYSNISETAENLCIPETHVKEVIIRHGLLPIKDY